MVNPTQDNLTPYGTASQSSNHETSLPENAIKPPISNIFSISSCAHTALVPGPAWWMFHFSSGYAYITNIKLYYRENYAYRMDGFKLYVTNSSTIPPDGYLCYEDGPGLPNPSTTMTIQCRQLGTYIIYYDNTGDYQFGPIIELCYVAITGCRKGMWGTDCYTKCPTVCIGQHCHPENGLCVWGCGEQKCLNNRWDIKTGVCTEGCVREFSQLCNCYKYNITPYGIATQISNFESLPQNAREPPISNAFTSYNYVADQTPEYFWRRYESVRKNRSCKESSDKEIDDAAKDWLRFSLDREGGRKQRRERKNNINNNDTVEIQIEEDNTRGDDQ
ncbi:unnamed protein product [Mytilus edulis]|uniref:Uncharacterized protein n=1 Tax=Mytilus edulis TaxID=6550 RepID=A0A8S3TKN0_MYTED|nr:unnamed protein product [Mytilus edulis]